MHPVREPGLQHSDHGSAHTAVQGASGAGARLRHAAAAAAAGLAASSSHALPISTVQELKEAHKQQEATGIELLPDERNVFQWRALLKVECVQWGAGAVWGCLKCVLKCVSSVLEWVSPHRRPQRSSCVLRQPSGPLRSLATLVSRQPPPPCALQGPRDTPYEGGTFELSIVVPEQYPLVAPTGGWAGVGAGAGGRRCMHHHMP